MRHTFYCAHHDREEPREVYAGRVSGKHYCVESIASVRLENARKKRENRAAEIAREAKAKAGAKPKVMAINPNKGKARRRVEDILDARRLADSFGLGYV